jgi:transcriptional regulator with XRE-family HTH domain
MHRKEPTTIFGRRLRAARLRADIPQDRLGVKIGLDEATASVRVSRYETGVHAPAFGVAVKLANALSVPTAYFYCEDDELALLVLGWARLPKSERKHIRLLIESKLASPVIKPGKP